MKTDKEILEDKFKKILEEREYPRNSDTQLLRIMQIAYNMGVDDAADNAEWCVSQNDDGMEPFHHESNIYIDRQSILKVKQ